MLDAVLSAGPQAPASAAANALIRAVASGARTRRAPAANTVEPTAQSQPTRGKSELTPEELEQVRKLKQQDRQVRRHEAAHKAAAGSLAKGGATFEYTSGPDGRRYATGGEVQIDTPDASGDPRETIRKAQQVRRAALSPAQPSAQDRKVAAEAAATEARARAELAKQRRAQGGGAQGPNRVDPTAQDSAGDQPANNGATQAYPGGRASGAQYSPDTPPGRFIDVSV